MDKDELYQKLLTKVIAFLGYKPRTRKEISLRLGRYLKAHKALDEDTQIEITDRIFVYLEENKLIDDKEYIKLFVEAKTRGKSAMGKKAIQNKLMAKGISKEDAAAFVETTVSEEDELNSAIKALANKYKHTALDSSKETHDKLGRFWLSRGFSYATSKLAVDYLAKRP